MMTNPVSPSISIIIPAYNSQDTLGQLTNRLISVLPTLCPLYEIVIVNDGSRDRTWEEIKRLSLADPSVRGINLFRNYGQHNALLCGVRLARYAIIITMDDDLQHPPEQIPVLLEKFFEGFDVVYGCPKKLPHSFWRNIASRISKRLLAFVMGIKTVREISAFRVFKTDLRKAFNQYQSPGLILDVLLSWGTENFSSVQIDENPRLSGHSNYTFFKLLSQVFLILTGYSTLPLRFASFLGFGFTVFGIIVFAYVVILYFSQGSIPGFPFLASIISLFSGMQLFSLGIIGEYLARMFDRSLDRPSYIIGETTYNEDLDQRS